MKKVFAIVLIFTLMLSGCKAPGKESDGTWEKETQYSADQYSADDIEGMNEPGEVQIAYDDEDAHVVSIDGKFSKTIIKDSDDAIDALQNVRKLIGLEKPDKELTISSVNSDEYGAEYTFAQSYNGYEVFASGVTVSVDKEGVTDSLGSGLCPTELLQAAPSKPSITQTEAEERVKQEYGDGCEIDPERTKITYYALNEYENEPILAYVISAGGTDREGQPIHDSVIVNAVTGEIATSYSEIMCGLEPTGVGENEFGEFVSFPIEVSSDTNALLWMKDPSRNIEMYDYSSGQGVKIIRNRNSWKDWDDKMAVSAYTNIITVYDWYKENLGRKGIDDKDGKIIVTVHNNTKYTSNAYWWSYDKTLNFCDNNYRDSSLRTYAAPLDVAAHEYTHGVVYYITEDRLIYSKATGAIDEGYADVFGAFVQGDWEHAEDRKTNRDASNPTKYKCPDKMSSPYFQSLDDPYDNYGVHKNASLIYHPAYLMSIGGLPEDKLFQVWYKSLYMGYYGNSDFLTVRRNLIKAARRIGFSESEIQIIRNAFDQVEIYEGKGLLTINVEDEDGNHLPGAHVHASGFIWKATLHMNGDKLYSEHLYPGIYTVNISLDGYLDYFKVVTVSFEEETELTVILRKSVGGKCGDQLTWFLNSDGVLTISGIGPMYDASREQTLWSAAQIPSSQIKQCIIEEGVTSIGEWAFYKCTGMTTISAPSSLTSIGTNAFYQCSSLNDVYYEGSKAEGYRISIASGNEAIFRAKIHFNGSDAQVTFDTASAISKAVSMYGSNIAIVNQDGTVSVYGPSFPNWDPIWKDIVQVSMGKDILIGIDMYGNVFCAGPEYYSGGFSSPNAALTARDWTDIVYVYASWRCALGVTGEGKVVATSGDDQLTTQDWTDILLVTKDSDFSTGRIAGVKTDGTVVVAGGHNDYGECDVSGWRDIVQVVIGNHYTAGLTRDGRVLTAGNALTDGAFFPTDEFDTSDWEDVVFLASGGYGYSLFGLKSDGTVLCTGHPYESLLTETSKWKDIRCIIADPNGEGLIGIDKSGKVYKTEWEDADLIPGTIFSEEEIRERFIK